MLVSCQSEVYGNIASTTPESMQCKHLYKHLKCRSAQTAEMFMLRPVRVQGLRPTGVWAGNGCKSQNQKIESVSKESG